MRRFLLPVIVASLLPTAAQAAPCAIVGNVPTVLTPPGAVLEIDGGVLVASTSGRREDVNQDISGDPSQQPSWKIVARKRKLATTMVVLAPGLARYDAIGNGEQRLVDADGKTRLKFAKRGKLVPPPAAPALVVRAIDATKTGDGRFARTTFTAQLASETPTGTVALIMYKHDAKAKTDTAMKWVQVLAPNKSIPIENFGRTCGVAPKGTVRLSPGDAITIAWVDASGRVSVPSNVVEVPKPTAVQAP